MAAATLDDVCRTVEVSGPGFINLTLRDDFVAAQVADAVGRPAARRGAGGPARDESCIDYSAPNVAKEMHVGHLRSTLIGDALARVLGFLGHDVRAGEPHRGLGHAVRHADRAPDRRRRRRARRVLQRPRPQRVLRPGRAGSSTRDPTFAERCRQRVVLLQSGDPETHAPLARSSSPRAMRHAHEVYDLLGVLLTDDDVVGESFYNPFLAGRGRRARRQGAARRGRRRAVRLPRGLREPPGRPAAAHRAQVRRRLRLPGHRPGLRPRPHAAGSAPPGSSTWSGPSRRCTCAWSSRSPSWPATCPTPSTAVHVGFGLVLGTDGKKLASRSGESERLVDLLTEASSGPSAALKRARQRPRRRARRPRWPARSASARSSTPTCRPSGCATTSSTGTACWPSRATPAPTCSTRTPASARSSGAAEVAPPAPGTPPLLGEPPERALALQLLRFAEAVEATAETLQPVQALHLPLRPGHRPSPPSTRRAGSWSTTRRCARRASALCDLTARVLEQGLSLLGMEAPEQM